MSLKNKKILLGLTGGIACYKIPYLVRYLTKAQAEVQIVMTESATKFITPLTLETISQRPVALEMFPQEKFVSTRHIDLAGWPDLIMIAPATANFIGKVASGISDDLLTTIVCATPKQVIIAPAMNPGMWNNKITQRNVRTLDEAGYKFIQPVEGDMACDHYGVGRMPEPDELFNEIKSQLKNSAKKKTEIISLDNKLKGKKIIVTAGPTREQIDPVRYISNNSSGKMGYALAEAARRMGADVTLISGPTNLQKLIGIKHINILSTDQLFKAVKKEFKKSDILIMAAAPADFSPANKSVNKIKKTDNYNSINLKPTVDILNEIKKLKTAKQVTVGFALETDSPINNARKKLKAKSLDMIVLNVPTETTGFDSDTNQVTILRPKKKPVELKLDTKEKISHQILDLISSML